MSSIAGLLVPNNFSIASSGGDIAEGLYSNNNSNVINTTASPNPTSGQVLTANSANAATWQEPDVTLINSVALTNKDLTHQSNFSIASSLWSGSGTNPVAIRAGANPTTGQVLTATSPSVATWQFPVPPVNNVQGGFSGVFGGGTGSVLETIELGNNPGAFIVEMRVIVNSNTGSSSTGWKVFALFSQPLAGGNVVANGPSVATPIAGNLPMSGEPSPTLEIVPGSTQIRLVKQGNVLINTFWGGSWEYSVSG